MVPFRFKAGVYGQVNDFLSKDVVQVLIVVISFGLVIWLVATRQDVPKWLVGVIMAIVGYYFGVQGGEAATLYRLSQKIKLGALLGEEGAEVQSRDS